MPTYFLGANSKDGFVSLYETFPPGERAFLHVIKGGPGTGKSSLLRAIADAAEERGLEVHRVLCSGDPDSLDGVYLPALGQAWADGTAPHVLEPGLFGSNGDYVNLTAFFVRPFSAEEQSRLMALQQEYRAKYREAYGLLAASWALGGGKAASCPDSEVCRLVEELPQQEAPGKIARRFLSAITCKGLLRLHRELDGYSVMSASPETITDAVRIVRRKGWSGIYCPSPLDTAQAEALLLPERRLAFTALPAPKQEALVLMSEAILRLKEAKALHDELESLYKPHMDFPALSEYTDRLLEKLFSQKA